MTKYISYTVGDDCMVVAVTDTEVVDIVLYPNPASGVLHIDGLEGEANVHIYSLLGEQLISQRTKRSIDVNALPTGVYLLEALINEHSIVKMFVKR